MTEALALDSLDLPTAVFFSLSNFPPLEIRGKIFSRMAVKRVSASGTARSKVGQNFKKQTTDDSIASTHIKSCDEDNFDTPGSTAMLEPCQHENIVDTCGMIASIPIVKAPDKRQYPARTHVHAAVGLTLVNFSSN
mmetsp:Transcript_34042/g.69452  ORF Transcript_34042/g.69452 Transcript_34042/m.69452 type:complete len:136 (+) Transcript_34042:4602-5009(+)